MANTLKAETVAKFNSGKITEEQYLTDMIFYENQEKSSIKAVVVKGQAALAAIDNQIKEYEKRLEKLKGIGE